jgi:hypothetical protein
LIRRQLRSIRAAATARCLAAFGVEVRLSDLYPEMYSAADGYVTRQPFDASEPEHRRYAFELACADCTAIVTNTPHNTKEACAIVENLIALVERQSVDFAAALFRSIWGAEPGRWRYLNRPSFYGEILRTPLRRRGAQTPARRFARLRHGARRQ